MAREWMTRATPVRLQRVPTAPTPARVGTTTADDSGNDTAITFAPMGPNASKGAALGGAIGSAAGLWFGFVRGGHAVGWPMLGWSLLGGLFIGAVGQATGGLLDSSMVYPS